MTEHPEVRIAAAIMRCMRAICAGLPEAVEAETFGAPTFQIRAKNFAMVRGAMPQAKAGTSVWCKAAPGVQDAYLTRDPVRYFAPPYLGPKGWVAASLDDDVDPDWDEIEELVIESYRLIAPRRLVARMESE